MAGLGLRQVTGSPVPDIVAGALIGLLLLFGSVLLLRTKAKAANGNMTLTGTVPDGDERAAAELLVAGLTGVRSVRNNIRIRPDADQPRSLD